MEIRNRLLGLPLVRDWRRERHRARFLSPNGAFSFYGVYDDFAQARRDLPPHREFEAAPLVDDYVDVRSHRIFLYDYPMLFWLGRALRSGAHRVLDLGGSVGVHYLAYGDRLEFPEDLDWVVWELPAIAEIGREVARRSGARGLRFVEAQAWRDEEADVWICAGALQYLEHGRPADLLGATRHLPEHLLLNKLPLYDGPDYVCNQNIGDGCYAPVHAYNRAGFIGEIESFGYELSDSWDNLERQQYVPGHPEKSFGCFSGLYFRRVRSPSPPGGH